MSLYDDIASAQVKQGNLGGKSGPLGSYAKSDKSKKHSPASAEKGQKRRVKLTILSGSIYLSTDSNGLSDPYCKVGRDKGILTSWSFSTPSQPKTLQPVWNHTDEVEVWSKADSHRWIIEVWDKDLIKDDFVGKGNLELSCYTLSDGKQTRTINCHPTSLGIVDTKTITATVKVEIEVVENLN